MTAIDPQVVHGVSFQLSFAATLGLMSLAPLLAARARAFLKGRAYVTPEDVKQLAPDVLRHRIIITYEAEAEEVTSSDIVQRILDHVEVP